MSLHKDHTAQVLSYCLFVTKVLLPVTMPELPAAQDHPCSQCDSYMER